MRMDRRAGLIGNKQFVWKKYSITKGSSVQKSGTFYGHYKYSIVDGNFNLPATTSIQTGITNEYYWLDYKYTPGVASTQYDSYTGNIIYEITGYSSNNFTMVPITIEYVGDVKNKNIFAYPLNGQQGNYYYKLDGDAPPLIEHTIVKHINAISANYYNNTYKTNAEKAIGRAISDGDQDYTYIRLASDNYTMDFTFDLSDLTNIQITQVMVKVFGTSAASAYYAERLTCFYGNRNLLFNNQTSTSRGTKSFELIQTSLNDLLDNFYVQRYNYSNYNRVGYTNAIDVEITYLSLT